MSEFEARLKQSGWYSHLQTMGKRNLEEFLGFHRAYFNSFAISLLEAEMEGRPKDITFEEAQEIAMEPDEYMIAFNSALSLCNSKTEEAIKELKNL